MQTLCARPRSSAAQHAYAVDARPLRHPKDCHLASQAHRFLCISAIHWVSTWPERVCALNKAIKGICRASCLTLGRSLCKRDWTMISDLRSMKALLGGARVHPGSPVPRARIGAVSRRQSRRRTSALLELNPLKSKNGSRSQSEVAAIETDVKQQLHYRLAAKQADTAALYRSVAWSVHNRLLDSFEKTHAHWR